MPSSITNEILSLREECRDLVSQARSKFSEITETTPASKAEKIEGEFDDLMKRHDQLDRKARILEAADMDAGYQLDERAARGQNVSSRGHFETEETRAVSAFLRAPQSRQAQAAMAEIESRDASGLSDPAGGYLVPEVISGPIASRARDMNTLRPIVRTVRVRSGDVVFPLSEADATAGWVGETDTRSKTTEPTLVGRIPTFGINYAYLTMTEELANDSVIDVADWFVREAGMALGEAESAAIVSGNGSNRPTGLLNTAPGTGADGSRSPDSFKAIETASATAITADEMLDAIYDLKSRYRMAGTWAMNSATAGAVRKLKDSNGAYLWQPSLIAGQPQTFAGYPVVLNEDMQDIGAGNHPIAFGDFESGYILADIGGLYIQAADRNITTPGLHKVYIRQRVGGTPYDTNAIRFLRNAAS